MNTFITRSIQCVTAAALMTITQSAFAGTTTRTCPYSCKSIGQTRADGCHDYRNGNQCTVTTTSSSTGTGTGVTSTTSASGDKICLSTSGKFRTRAQCRTTSGEVELTAAALPELSDIQLLGVPSKETVTGVIGATVQSPTTGASSTDASFGFKPITSLLSTDIIVGSTSQLIAGCAGSATNCLSSEEVSGTTNCTGSVSNPTAPAGKICVYPTNVVNANQIRAYADPENGSLHGFTISWNAVTPGTSAVDAVWAYTAQ